MTRSEEAGKVEASGGVDVVFAADANVALPLAVALASVARSLGAGDRLRAFVLVEGFDDPLRRRVEQLRSPVPVDVHWIEVDDARLPTVPAGARFPPAAYFRAALGELLPVDVRRVVYLDADVVVAGPFRQLYDVDLGEAVVGAVVDANRPTFASVAGSAWQGRGIPATAPYFNSGVLVVDVDRWRGAGVGDRVLRFVHDHFDDLESFPDQDALNVVLHGAWAELPAGWNQTASVHLPVGPVHQRLASAELAHLRRQPQLVHYTGALPRPWVDPKGHPLAELWYEALESTDWAGWRPDRAAVWARRVKRSVRGALAAVTRAR